MEKFSNWRDKATGVAPFLQISNQTNVLKAALTVVSVVVRVPLLLVLTHFLVILPNAPKFVLSSILYVLGVFSWDVQVTGVKKKSYSDTKPFLPKAGSLIYTNFISPLDPIVYASLFKCIFAVPHPSNGQIIECNLFFIIKYALSIQDIAPPVNAKKVSLDMLAKKARSTGSVIIFFGEGTTSNGRGLLTTPSINSPLTTDLTVVPAGLRYGPQYLATPLPRYFLGWLWTVLYGFQIWSVRLRFGAPIITKDVDSSIDEITSSLCQIGRLKKLGSDLDIHAKREFLKAQQNYK